MSQKWKQRLKLYGIYTILFILIATIVFVYFWKNNRTFIWQADGLKQHYIILRDFHETIRNFLASSENKINLFSWNMGLGMDVIGQYSYYVLGDPFAYLSLPFPVESLEMVYIFLILLRMFCTGLAFIVYAKYHKHNNVNILLGAIIYTFSSFVLFAGIRHPYFLNALILFPLLLLGVDKLLQENKKVLLCTFIAISAISNYYFFYMHMIMIVIYAIVRYLCEYRKEGVKHFLKKLGSGITCAVIGVLIASILLFPTAYAFLNSARSGEETTCEYSQEYYESIFTIDLLSAYGQNSSYIGVSSIILLMLPVLITRRKQNKTYFWYWCIATVFLLIPFIGSALNGFAYPNNRWAFIYTFILAYIITLCFELQYTEKEKRNMFLLLLFYSVIAIAMVLCKSAKARFIILLVQIILAFVMFFIMQNKNNTEKNAITSKRLKIMQYFMKHQTVIFTYLAVIINIGVMAYGLYSSYDRKYAESYIKEGKADETIATQYGNNPSYEKAITNTLKMDNTFYRIAKLPHTIQNLSIYYGYPSTECFLSIGNGHVYDLNKELADSSYRTTYCVQGLGDRAKITTLVGTKYYISDEKHKSSVPYGYNLKAQNDGTLNNQNAPQSIIYENQFPLSVGVAYSKYLLREDYEKLNPLEKEDALLKAAVIDSKEEIPNLNLTKKENIEDIKSSIHSLDYQLTDENQIIKEKEVVTTKANQSAFLTIPEVKNSELYVLISGYNFQGDEDNKVTATFQEKKVNFSTENKITSAYYHPNPEILLPLGYYEEAQGDIELTFSRKGTYKFEKLEVIAVPMENYEKEVKELQNNQLQNVVCLNDEIKGNVNLSSDSILQISTSYTTGWKAFVDGEKVDTIRVNTAFIGVPVSQGAHEITLKYETPYLKIGIVFSILGVASFIVLVILEKKRNMNNS